MTESALAQKVMQNYRKQASTKKYVRSQTKATARQETLLALGGMMDASGETTATLETHVLDCKLQLKYEMASNKCQPEYVKTASLEQKKHSFAEVG